MLVLIICNGLIESHIVQKLCLGSLKLSIALLLLQVGVQILVALVVSHNLLIIQVDIEIE